MKQNQKLKAAAGILMLLLCLFFISGCSIKPGGSSQPPQDGASGTGITVTVRLVSTEKTILDQQVVLTDDMTAGRAVKDACQSQRMAYVVEDGLYSSFDGIASTQTDGWLFYYNGELPDNGADDVVLNDGDIVEFRFVNFDEAFKL